MRSQISVEFVITISLFVFLLMTLFAVMFNKIDEYNGVQERQDMIFKCKTFGDFLATNLSYRLNELNMSAVRNFVGDKYYMSWSDEKGFHSIGNPNFSFSVYRFYIIDGEIRKVKVGCV